MAITITGVKRESDSTLRPGKHANIIEWTEIYTVQTTGIETSHVHVMSSAVTNVDTLPYLPGGALPVPNLTISADGYAVCQSLNGRRLDENVRVWEFTSTWSSEVKSSNSNDPNVEDVETIIPLRKVLFEPVNRYRVRDYAGQAYINGAGTLFNPVMEVEEELSRWEFSQLDPVHSGVGPGIVTLNYPSVTATGKVRPPGIYSNSTLDTMIGTTDDTIHYFNGAINSHVFRFKAEFTLKLNVRDSNIVQAYGKKCRLTEYTITHDNQRWFDKPINCGPFFLAPKLDAGGNPVVDVWSKYDYIYHTKDIEDPDCSLSQDETGPLGYYTVDPEIRGDIRFYNSSTIPFGTVKPIRFGPSMGGATEPYVWTRTAVPEDGFPLGGYVLVTGPNGSKTYRALRPNVTQQWHYIERLNHFMFDFGDYLRVM